MKTSQIFAVSMLAVACAGVASADVTVRITGATAFRAATHNAIRNVLNGETYGFVGGNLNGASEAVFKGTVPGVAGTVTVVTNWSGSAAGVHHLAANDTLVWLTDVAANMPNGVIAAPARGSATTADVAMSDVFPATTGFTGGSFLPLIDQPVGIVPFAFIKGQGKTAAMNTVLAKINNITGMQARQLLNGSLQASMLTGNGADVGKLFPIGRDGSSGTRINTFLETGYGLSGIPLQANVGLTGGAISSISVASGNGYSSGGNVTAALAAPYAATTTVSVGGFADSSADYALIGYAGLADIVNNNLVGQVIGYNGASIVVGGAVDFTSIKEGKYSLWGYEHLLYRESLADGDVKTVADALAVQLATVDATFSNSGLLLDDTVKVARDAEGSPVYHN